MEAHRHQHPRAPSPRALEQPDHEVVIVGTGFSGLGMAIKLKEAGIEDFVVIEKADSVAGTWRENTYPGCACDVPSHMYSFSFEPNPDWSEMYAPQQEIRDYLERCADKYELRPHIRLPHPRDQRDLGCRGAGSGAASARARTGRRR